MKRQLLALLFFFILLPIAWAGGDSPSLQVTNVNGYDVYLINIHQGNEVSFDINVMAGAWQDNHPGLAHYLEHLTFLGSKKYPGAVTAANLYRELGASHGAATSYTRTFFPTHFHYRSLEQVVQIQGAMMSGLDWNIRNDANELKVVTNEAASNQIIARRALDASPFLYLAKEHHPLGMYEVGTTEQLTALTQTDAKELFYANYVPGSAQIIVAGNFDALPDGTIPLHQDQVLQLIQTHFRAPDSHLDSDLVHPLPAPSHEKIFPSLFDTENPARPRALELGTTENERMMSLTFEATGDINPDVLKVLNDYLSVQTYRLLSANQWATSSTYLPVKVNNLRLIRFNFDLTEAGAQQREGIQKLFFNVLHHVQKNGISREYLKYMKDSNIHQAERNMLSSEETSSSIGQALDWGKEYAARLFSAEERFASITNADLQLCSRNAFSPERMLTAYLGPEITSDEVDPTFHRPIRRVNNRLVRKNLQQVLDSGLAEFPITEPILYFVPLDFSTQLLKSGNFAPRPLESLPSLGVDLLLEENHQNLSGGLSLNLKLKPLNLSETAAVTIYLEAFKNFYAPSLRYIRNYGIDLGIYGPINLVFRADGNSGGARSAIRWAYSHFHDFVPTAFQLELEVNAARQRLAFNSSTFSTDVTSDIASTLLRNSQFTSAEIDAEILKIGAEPSLLSPLAESALHQSDIQLTGYGNYDESEMRTLLSEVSEKFPQRLSPEVRIAQRAVWKSILSSEYLWTPLADSAPDNYFGWTRVYRGPTIQTPQGRALRVLTSLLHERVFTMNRVEQGLGYVEKVEGWAKKRGYYLFFSGEATGADNLTALEMGWNHVINQLKNRTITRDEFSTEKRALIRKLKMLPSVPGGALDDLSNYYFLNGTLPDRAQEIEKIEALTADEIYAAADEFLVNAPSLNVIASNAASKQFICKEGMHTRK